MKKIVLLLCFAVSIGCFGQKIASNQRVVNAVNTYENKLKAEFLQKKLSWGSPLFLRIFKEENTLEVWVQKGEQFELFKSYPICYFSGDLGPKTTQGDGQSPEGFYFIKPNQMNPWSSYHLSFNIGYPNQYDKAHGYTGNYLMVHGSCVSIGCYAMTDPVIEQLFVLIKASFDQNQPFVRLHIFPFKLTDERLNKERQSDWYSFWKNLKTGYDWFENKKRPPNVEVSDNMYVFE